MAEPAVKISVREKKRRLRNSLRYSFLDGVFASIQFGFTDQFVVPLALFFGAGNVAVGILSFVRNALVSIVQVQSAEITQRLGSRKRFVTTAVLLAAVMWLPTFFLPLYLPRVGVPLFIVLFALTSCLNLMATPAWASLISEYIPYKKRGQYFGFRNTALGMIYFVSLIVAGSILHFYEAFSLIIGFSILILSASLTRMISWAYLTRHYEPRWRPRTEDYFSFQDFIRRLPQSNFARYAILSGLFMFAVAIVSPFFAVFLLREAGFNYLFYTLIISGTILTTYATQRYWGSFADRYGNFKIIVLTAVSISLIPFLWIFSRNFYYLVVIQLFAGFLWAGFNLTSVNFIYDAAMVQKRERCIAYYNFLSGIGLGAGALLGGFLYRHLPPLHGSSFYSLLAISGVLRFAFSHSILVFTREVRKVTPIQAPVLLLDIFGVRALGLLGRELLVRFRRRA